MYTASEVAVVYGERVIWKNLARTYRERMVEILNDELPHFGEGAYIVAGYIVTQRGRVVFERTSLTALYDLRFIHTLTTILNFERHYHKENKNDAS